jgi:hypothetical protein
MAGSGQNRMHSASATVAAPTSAPSTQQHRHGPDEGHAGHRDGEPDTDGQHETPLSHGLPATRTPRSSHHGGSSGGKTREKRHDMTTSIAPMPTMPTSPDALSARPGNPEYNLEDGRAGTRACLNGQRERRVLQIGDVVMHAGWPVLEPAWSERLEAEGGTPPSPVPVLAPSKR